MFKKNNIIFDRIQFTENYFGAFCSEISKYAKKEAAVRDKYDDLSEVLKHYANLENFHETLTNGMVNYSKALTLLADAKELQIQRFQLKMIREMSAYENVCKNTRDGMKHSIMMRDKQMARLQQIEQIRQRSMKQNDEKEVPIPNEPPITNEFEENVAKFEQQKNHDIKQILMDFTRIQLKYHTKSLEILSAVFKDIAAIDEEADLEEFKNKFLPHENQSIKPQMRSRSMSALTAINQPTNDSNKRGLSNSTYSLDSPPKQDSDERKRQSSPVHSIDLNQIESISEETTHSETDDDDGLDEISYSSASIVEQVKAVKKFIETDDEEDDDDVIVKNSTKPKKKTTAFVEQSGDQMKGQSPKPLPRTRLSKSHFQ